MKVEIKKESHCHTRWIYFVLLMKTIKSDSLSFGWIYMQQSHCCQNRDWAVLSLTILQNNPVYITSRENCNVFFLPPIQLTCLFPTVKFNWNTYIHFFLYHLMVLISATDQVLLQFEMHWNTECSSTFARPVEIEALLHAAIAPL